MSKVIPFEGRNEYIPLKRIVFGFLLFAATWDIIQTITICLTYHHVHLWTALLGNGALYFLPGLVFAGLFFCGLRLWLRWRGNPSRWLMVSAGLSLFLCMTEIALVGASLAAVGGQLCGLIIGSILSSLFWLRRYAQTGG